MRSNSMPESASNVCWQPITVSACEINAANRSRSTIGSI
jgi:hypothetical protein